MQTMWLKEEEEDSLVCHLHPVMHHYTIIKCCEGIKPVTCSISD